MWVRRILLSIRARTEHCRAKVYGSRKYTIALKYLSDAGSDWTFCEQSFISARFVVTFKENVDLIASFVLF